MSKAVEHLHAMVEEWSKFDLITWGSMLAVAAAMWMLFLTLEVIGAVIAIALVLAWAHLDTVRGINS